MGLDGSIDREFRRISTDERRAPSPRARRLIGSALLFVGAGGVAVCLPLFVLGVGMVSMGFRDRGFELPWPSPLPFWIAVAAALVGAVGLWLSREPAPGWWSTIGSAIRALLQSAGVFGVMLASGFAALAFTLIGFHVFEASLPLLGILSGMLGVSLLLLTATTGPPLRGSGRLRAAVGVLGRLLAHLGWATLVLSLFVFPTALGLAMIGFAKFPWFLLAVAGAAAGPAMMACGLVAMSPRKKLVLFLRRFGNDDLNLAIRRAVRDHLGSSFRLITLDDLSFRPAGSPSGPKAIAAATIALTATVALLATKGVLWTLERVRVAEAVETNLAVPGAIDGMEGWYFEIFLDAVASGSIAVAFYIATLGVVIAIAILVLGRRTRLRVARERDLGRLERQARRLRSWFRGARLFAPQATVVKVADQFWQAAVSLLLRDAAAVIIDISVPSESILWELRSIREGSAARPILLARGDLLDEWLGRAGTLHSKEGEALAAARGLPLIAYSRPERLDVRALARAMASPRVDRNEKD